MTSSTHRDGRRILGRQLGHVPGEAQIDRALVRAGPFEVARAQVERAIDSAPPILPRAPSASIAPTTRGAATRKTVPSPRMSTPPIIHSAA